MAESLFLSQPVIIYKNYLINIFTVAFLAVSNEAVIFAFPVLFLL